jgi:hypothetical protein
VGTVYRNVSTLLGKETEVIFRVAAHEAPHRLELDGEASSSKLHDTIRVTRHGEQVRVHYRAEFAPHGVSLVALPLLPLGLKKLGDAAAEQMQKCLQRL